MVFRNKKTNLVKCQKKLQLVALQDRLELMAGKVETPIPDLHPHQVSSLKKKDH